MSIGTVIGYHFQRLAGTAEHRRDDPLMEQFLRLLGLILNERFHLTVVKVHADSWNTNGHTHGCTSFSE